MLFSIIDFLLLKLRIFTKFEPELQCTLIQLSPKFQTTFISNSMTEGTPLKWVTYLLNVLLYEKSLFSFKDVLKFKSISTAKRKKALSLRSEEGAISARALKKALFRFEQRRRCYLGASSEEGAITARTARKRYLKQDFFFLQFCSGSPTRSHVSRGEWRKSSAGIFFSSLRPWGFQNF